MRHPLPVITFLLFAGLAAACTSLDGKSSAEPKHSAIVVAKGEAAKAEKKEAAKAQEDYEYARKAEFVASMKKELADIQTEIDRLSAKVDKSTGAAKVEAKAQLEAVRAQWAKTKTKLNAAESATESSWEDVKAGFRESYGDLKVSFEKTRQWLSDKIEP